MIYYMVHFDVIGSFCIELEAENEEEARRLAEIEAKDQHGHLIDKQVIDRFEIIEADEFEGSPWDEEEEDVQSC